jgi:hypothetical protein
MLKRPAQLLHRDQYLAQSRIHHRLARIQARDPRNQHGLENFATLPEGHLSPLYLCCFGLRDCAVDAVCGGRIDAPEGLTGRGSVALDQRGAGDLFTVNCYPPSPQIMHTFKPGSSSTSPFHPGFACSGVSTTYLTASSGSARQVSHIKESAAIQSVPYKTTLKSLSARAVMRSILLACNQGHISRVQKLFWTLETRNGAKTRGHLKPIRLYFTERITH